MPGPEPGDPVEPRVQWPGADPARELGRSVHAVILRAFDEPPHPPVPSEESFLESWERPTGREGFRLLTIGEAGSDGLRGFLYGYRA